MRGSVAGRIRRVTCVAAVGVMVAASGCGSDSDEGESAAAQARSDTTSSTASGGKRIVVGLLVQTNNNVQSTPEQISTGRAAARYVNNELGGVDGGQIDLRICETRNTSESVVACANKLTRLRPVAVVAGADVGMEAGMKIFASARVPVIGGHFYFPKEVAGPPPTYRSVMVGAGLSLMPAIASFAVETFKAKKVVYISQEGGKPVHDAFLNAPMRKLGAPPADFIGAPVTASDLTPYFQAAASKDPDVVAVSGLPCVPALEAFRTSGSDAKLLQPAQCADAETLEEAGDLAEGGYYIFGTRVPALDAGNADVKAFEAALRKYAPDEKHASSDFGAAVFQGVMNVADLARELPGKRVTAEAMQRAVRSAKGEKNWLGLSGRYTCDPPPMPEYPSVCSSEAQLAQYKHGKLRLAQSGSIETGPLLATQGGAR